MAKVPYGVKKLLQRLQKNSRLKKSDSIYLSDIIERIINKHKNQVAGPSAGSPTRILVDLSERVCGAVPGNEVAYDICNGMGREAWRQGIVGF